MEFLAAWCELQGLDTNSTQRLLNNLIAENTTSTDPLAFEFRQIINLELINTHRSNYNLLVEELTIIFLYLTTHKRSQDSRSFLEFYPPEQFPGGFKFLAQLWALLIFNILTKAHQPLHQSLTAYNNFITLQNNSWTLIELIEEAYRAVADINSLLFVKNLLPNPTLDEILIKKLIHELIRTIDSKHPGCLFTCSVKEYREVIKPTSQHTLQSMLRGAGSNINLVETKNEPAFKKLTVVKVNISLTSGNPPTPWVFLRPPAIAKKGSTEIVHGLCWLMSYRLIIQKKTKRPTNVTNAFIEKVAYLQETKIFPCEQMITTTKILMLTDYKQLIDKYLSELHTYGEVKTSNGLNISELLSMITKRKVMLQEMNNNKKFQIFGELKNLYKIIKEDSTLFMEEVLKFAERTQTTSNLNTSYKLYQQNHHFLTVTQNFLAKLRLLNDAMWFFQFLMDNQIQYFYYSIYADFRGRIYYKSPFSPQKYWYYRFIFHFGVISDYETYYNLNLVPTSWLTPEITAFLAKLSIKDSNLISVFCSIGILFKSQLLKDESGAIKISDLILHGLTVYKSYSSMGEMAHLTTHIKIKTKIELLYYINIIKSHLSGKYVAYYLQKDTTCSMAQHAGKLLGYREEALPYLNLNNRDEMYDTYQIYINYLKEYLKKTPLESISVEEKAQIITALNRDLLKNLIMTTEYGVTYYTAWREFLQTIHEQNLSNEVRKNFINLGVFKILFEVLREDHIDMVFYLSNKQAWLKNFLRDNQTYFELSDIQIPIDYYKQTYRSLYYRNTQAPGRARLTALVPINCAYETKNEINYPKIQSATYVNAVHSIDASYLRSIVSACKQKKLPIITIHDGFCVPYHRETALRSIANVCFFENSPTSPKSQLQRLTINSTTILI